ncbi:MAG: DNA repair protein RecO [Bacteroidota bacterium]
MLIKTRGIVLRALKYSETSIICDVFTERKGLRSYIISGVRSRKARVSAGLLQPMSLVDMVAYHRDDKELSRIKEIKAAHIYQSIPFDVLKGAVGLFMVELAQKTIRGTEEHPRLFQFLFESFQYLDTTPQHVANLHLHFMLGLSAFLGFLPGSLPGVVCRYFDLKEGLFIAEQSRHPHVLNEELSQLLYQLLQTDLRGCHEIKMNREIRNELLEQMIIFYRLHIENFPSLNAHTILKEVF